MYFFTSDEHYGHTNIIKYCNRPFKNIDEMNKEIIKRHNEVVSEKDTVIHAGDFCFGKSIFFATQLKGKHIFIVGSHDKWMVKSNYQYIWEKRIEDKYIVVCHYAMLTWPRSHYNSWQLFGHSHGQAKAFCKTKQYDIGVDNNNFYPISFKQLREILE